MRLRIRYRSSEDIVTVREISVLNVEPPNTMHAFCHGRQEQRSFVLDRVEEAVDVASGEVIPDIWVHFGLPSLKPLPLEMPNFSGRRPGLNADQTKALRSSDKHALFRKFKYEVIAKAKRRELLGLFGGRCFHCGAGSSLELDHHIPQNLGGRLIPGNIVILCNRCNLQKRTTHPSDFYTDEQLASLQPILEAQLRLFEFRFNWTRWTHHPEEYLVSLGASPEEARAAISDPSHPLYVGYDPRN